LTAQLKRYATADDVLCRGERGRLGVLDAAECPPTLYPRISTGNHCRWGSCLGVSSEDLEDRAEDGDAAIAQRQITQLDVVVGITAGGTTPFVHGAPEQRDSEERRFIACVPVEQVSAEADIDIRLW